MVLEAIVKTCKAVWPEAAEWGFPYQCELAQGHKGQHQFTYNHKTWLWR